MSVSECRLPGFGQEVLDALGPAEAFLQLLWTQRFLGVGLDVTLGDGNFSRFGELHVGETGRQSYSPKWRCTATGSK